MDPAVVRCDVAGAPRRPPTRRKREVREGAPPRGPIAVLQFAREWASVGMCAAAVVAEPSRWSRQTSARLSRLAFLPCRLMPPRARADVAVLEDRPFSSPRYRLAPRRGAAAVHRRPRSHAVGVMPKGGLQGFASVCPKSPSMGPPEGGTRHAARARWRELRYGDWANWRRASQVEARRDPATCEGVETGGGPCPRAPDAKPGRTRTSSHLR